MLSSLARSGVGGRRVGFLVVSSARVLQRSPPAPICRYSFTTTTSTTTSATSAVGRRIVSKEERAALRAARKERAALFIQQQQQQGSGAVAPQPTAAAVGGATTGSSTASSSSSSSSVSYLVPRSGWMVYGGISFVLTGLVVWGFRDPNSPPARLSHWIGLTNFISSWSEEYAKPAHDKLLPDWSQIPNVPHDIPQPLTLVLDLENTLVGSTWDKKYGWRHARRPGVDKFLCDMAQYYEIVLYSPSHEGLAAPVIEKLDKDGYIMHRLYREATYFHDGVHVKDLNRLNRPLKRIIVLDDDPAEVQFNPENLIRVKPYTDPHDQTDTTLARITPFLIEISREGYNDIPELLRQYRGMDADQIADEQERRLDRLKQHRQQLRQRGLGQFARSSAKLLLSEAPELPASSNYTQLRQAQLSAKDIAGTPPTLSGEDAPGLRGFFNRRAKEKEEHQMRKIEKWTEVMMKKQKENEAKEKAAAAAAAAAQQSS